MAATTQGASTNNLVYGGGSVATGQPKVYLVFWGSQWGTSSTDARGYLALSGDRDGMAPVLQAFFTGVGTGSETWSGVMTQYCQGAAAGAQSCTGPMAHVGYPTGGALAGVWADTAAAQPYWPHAPELGSEAARAAAHFGNTSEESNRSAQYFVVSAPGTRPDGFNTTGANYIGAQWCAGHSSTNNPLVGVGSSVPVAFVNMPYVSDAPVACGAGFVNPGPAGLLDGVTIVAGQIYADTITNPFPDGGWLDNIQGVEYGSADKCFWIPAGSGQGAAQNVTLTTGTFAVQSTWANDFNGGKGGCEVSHSIVTDNTASAGPAITTFNAATLYAGHPGSDTIATTGFPIPAVTESGVLPPGIGFTDNHDGTATLTGSSTQRSGGSYPITLKAANGLGNDAIQSFTLTVKPWVGTIVDFAGSATASPNGGDGGPATSAYLDQPVAVAIDAAGNVYIADGSANRVRKVDPTGNISTFAGNGTTGFGTGALGDGGPATSATIDWPDGLAADGAGNVYVSSRKDNRVRRIDTAGVITNFAGDPSGTPGRSGDGGPATSAALLRPEGIALDRAGNLYIADGGNRRVRKVDTAGVITNFAGDPSGVRGNSGDGGAATSATFEVPVQIAADSAGNVYIADHDDHRVRKVNPAGVISNFAGDSSGTAGNGGDGGPATSATLTGPSGVAVDSGGNVFISDSTKNRVRRVDVAGVIANFAGDPSGDLLYRGDGGPAPAAFLWDPFGLAVDLVGNVYIDDAANQRVRVVLTGPAIVSDPSATFTPGVPGTWTVSAAGLPPPAITRSGELPAGSSFNSSTHQLIWTPPQGSAGTYPLTFRAANGAGSDATQQFTLQVDNAPLITSAPKAALTVGVAGSLTITTAGAPTPTVTETGLLPPGVTFNRATGTFSGAPAPGSAGGYPITISAANGVGSPATQTLTLTVTGAELTYPTQGQTNIDTTQPFSWTTTSPAQAYYLVVGTTRFGYDLVNSGVLPPAQSSLNLPALPIGRTLFGTLLTEVNGTWSPQAVTFTAAPGEATFSFPLDAQTGIDPTRPITWATIPQAQGYILAVGTTKDGTNLVNSGVLPPTQSSYATPILPAGQTLYATLLTKVNGAWTRSQAITFVAGPAMGTFTHPVNGQFGVATPTAFTWSTIAGAQNYYLLVGTTRYGYDLVNSGPLPPSQASFDLTALPPGQVLYATVLTMIDGNWAFQAIAFIPS